MGGRKTSKPIFPLGKTFSVFDKATIQVDPTRKWVLEPVQFWGVRESSLCPGSFLGMTTNPFFSPRFSTNSRPEENAETSMTPPPLQASHWTTRPLFWKVRAPFMHFYQLPRPWSNYFFKFRTPDSDRIVGLNFKPIMRLTKLYYFTREFKDLKAKKYYF